MISEREAKFLMESNAIEGEYSNEAFEDAMVAWEYLRSLSKLSTNDVRIAHKLLMIRLRPDIAGKWRNCEVYIGGLRKNNLGTVVLESEVDALLKKVNTHKAQNPTKYARDLHVIFEEIHPFEDGNGRVGRMLYNWHRLRFGLELAIILAAERSQYYQWFRKGDGKF